MPDVQDARTYLAFLIILGLYFFVTSLPVKNFRELRIKLTMRFLDKSFDGTLLYVFDKTAALAMAGILLQPFVSAGILKPYGERQRQETVKLILQEVQRQIRLQAKPEPAPPPPLSAPAAQPEAPKPSGISAGAPPANGDRFCADRIITGWDATVLDGASLATCQQGRFVAFVCVEGSPYLVTAGPARTTQVRFYSRDGRDRSSLDDTLQPRDEAGFAVSNLSPETFSYFMDGMSARLTMPGRTIWVDLSGVKRAASPSLAACMS